MLNSFFCFYFFLKLFSIIMSIFSEKILMMILGFELNMFSIIPLIKNSKVSTFGFSLKTLYFVFQTFGSVFFYFGMLLFKKKILLFGLFKKIAGFPLFWFPLFLKNQNKLFLIFWICFMQKVPLYYLMKECVYMQKKSLLFFVLYYFIVSSFGMMFSKSLLMLVAWSKILHSALNLFLMKNFKLSKFLMFVVLFGIVLYFLLKAKMLKNKFFFDKFFNKKKIKVLVFFSLGGVPLFIKMMKEFALIKILKANSFIILIMISLMLQSFSFVLVFLKFFKKKTILNISLKKNMFFLFFFLCLMVFFWFIYGSF